MVEIWRWPKASYNASVMVETLTPRREAAPEADLVVRARPFGVGLPAFCLADEIDPRVAARCEQIQLARLEMNRMLNDTVQYARQIGLDG